MATVGFADITSYEQAAANAHDVKPELVAAAVVCTSFIYMGSQLGWATATHAATICCCC